MQRHCQSFREGCCGCCINMRWSDAKIMRYLEANTSAASRIPAGGGRPRFRDLVHRHWVRKGLWDHLLLVWLVIPTFGLSALIWRRWFASCPFAGYLEEDSGRVGCLIHPERVGLPDLRKHAFPLVPTANCNRKLLCPMLYETQPTTDTPYLDVSRAGFHSLHSKKPAKKPCKDYRPD